MSISVKALTMPRKQTRGSACASSTNFCSNSANGVVQNGKAFKMIKRYPIARDNLNQPDLVVTNPGQQVWATNKLTRKVLWCCTKSVSERAGVSNAGECNTCGQMASNAKGITYGGTQEILKDTCSGSSVNATCQNKIANGRWFLKATDGTDLPTTGPNGIGAQPKPHVKYLCIPPRKGYAFTTAQLIRDQHLGYQQNLAKLPCNGQTDCSVCCDDCNGSSWCRRGISGTSFEQNNNEMPGPCQCWNSTYKRSNTFMKEQGATDNTVFTDRIKSDAEGCISCIQCTGSCPKKQLANQNFIPRTKPRN